MKLTYAWKNSIFFGGLNNFLGLERRLITEGLNHEGELEREFTIAIFVESSFLCHLS